MQTGIRRSRSDSPDDTSAPSVKRPRGSALGASSSAPLVPTRTPTPALLATSSSSSSGTMARPSNGTTTDNGDTPIAGPSFSNGNSNGHSSIISSDRITRVQLPGSLMYEDDKDWVALDEADTLMDVDETDGAVGHSGPVSKRVSDLRATKRMPVDREEVVRVVLQSLRDIGYHQSATALEAESGYTLSPQAAQDFEAAILGGRWSEAIALLPHLGVQLPQTTDEPVISSSSSISSGKSKAVAASGKGTEMENIRFLISQQKYLEMLELGAQKKALAVLRNELAPVTRDSEVLHALSGFMMCMDRDDLLERAQWDGAAGTSRRRLLEQLQAYISPKIMLPSRRLATLLDQARRYQQQSCIYHTDPGPSSLYTDHQCATGAFPSVTTHILADHGDEVHNLAWSPDGSMLATAGQDKMVVIWSLEEITKPGGISYDIKPLHQLRDHRESVGVLAWSPDGATLVTAADRSLYLWDTKVDLDSTGEQKSVHMAATQHTDEISAVRWSPDGSEFVVASMDCKLIFYSPNGEMRRQWHTPSIQFRDFIITPDGSRIIAVTAYIRRHLEEPKPKPSMSGRPAHDPLNGIEGGAVEEFGYEEMDHGVMVIRIADKHIEQKIRDIGGEISSISLSRDGKRFLVNVEDEDVRLYTIEPHIRLIRQFSGHVHSRYLIRSCFGPPKDRYILSGSEDCHVYVWDSTSGRPIEVLQGHTDTVNAVAWNPVSSRRLFASCSDDHQIRIWQPPVQPEEIMQVDEQEKTQGDVDDTSGVIKGGIEL